MNSLRLSSKARIALDSNDRSNKIIMAEKTEKPRPKQTKIMDIAKPGKQVAASATARPVIVTNRPIMHDPMMTGPTPDAPEAKKTVPPSAAKLVIKPLSAEEAEPAETASKQSASSIGAPNLPIDEIGKKKSAASKEDDEPAEPAEPEQPAQADAAADAPGQAAPDTEPADEPEAPADEPETQVETTEVTTIVETEEITVTSSVPDDIGVPASNEASLPAKEAAKLEEDRRRQEEIDKLIEDKTYFLPINAASKRRSRRDTIVGSILAVLLFIALIILLMDVGIIAYPGIEAPTSFF